MKRFLHSAAILLCVVAAFTASGCMMLPVYSCVSFPLFFDGCTSDSRNEKSLNEELGNYSMCEFFDEELGVGFKIYDDGYYTYRWGYITVEGETLLALFDTYYNGETHIYVSPDEILSAFTLPAATVILAFDGGDIISKGVWSNNLNVNFDGLRLKYRSLQNSDFLPHERFANYISDENHILSAVNGTFATFYSGRARTVEGGEIKTYNIKLIFLYDGVFEIYDAQDERLISQGSYKLIDNNTATLQFGQNDNLYAEKPFASYPYLTISGSYYNGNY